MTERVPCIIPAYNEVSCIGRTLQSLDSSLVDPLVVVNGSDDATEEVTRSFGLSPLVLPEAGKLPAIQEGLRHLGNRALGPVLLTDADSVPYNPSLWPSKMTRSLDRDKPSVVAGRLASIDDNQANSVMRNFYYLYVAGVAIKNGDVAAAGANMAINLQNEAMLETVLALPHTWPGEDKLLAHTIQEAAGTARQLLSKNSMVLTSSRFSVSVLYRILNGHEATNRANKCMYGSRRAPGADFRYDGGKLIPYTRDDEESTLHKQSVTIG